MKRFIFSLMAVLTIAFLGCSTDDDKDDAPSSETEKVLDSGKETDGSTWKLKVVESYSEEEGKTVGISYSETSSDEKSRAGFGILKQTIKNTTTYKVLFTFQTKKATVTEDFWDRYELKGNSVIALSGAYRFADEEDGFSSYYLYGTISETSIKQLEQASIITFKVANSTDEEMDFGFVLPLSFQNAMMKYF